MSGSPNDDGSCVSVLITFSVHITEDGKKALLKLSKGDMRRALNVLQACHAAYDIVGEDEIYSCTGNPHPSDIETVVNSMLSDEFTTSYASELIYMFCINYSLLVTLLCK